ncbi:hypothetical protein KP509_28G070600 [Ceratopteris richardii]|nr:hypothetical protein KP509_28G070600 [Ceratopteris richardii]KAH7294426.1 hypothetical protein KP509_28G070600 [Ceratopteris richardii]
MYIKCDAIARGQQVFDHLLFPDTISWTILITGHFETGNAWKAIHYFIQMQHKGVSPDAVTFTCIAKACSHVGAIALGEAIHGEIIQRQFLEDDMIVGTALIDMYAKCGEMENAQKVFNRLPSHDIVSWAALIVGYCEQGFSIQGIDCFEAMVSEGVCPDGMILACVLKACGITRAVERGEQVHAIMVKLGLIDSDNVLSGALMHMYIKCDYLAKAQCVFNELSVRDRISWTTLILGFSEKPLGHKALECFDQMQYEDISPDAVTIGCVLKACSSEAAIDRGRHLHMQIIKSSMLGDNTMLGCALIDMYAKCGEPARAQQVFDELSKPDILAWNILVDLYSHQELNEKALNCIGRMKIDGISPDAVTFSCILKVSGAVTDVVSGKKVHSDIIKLGFLENNTILGNTLLDMYIKCEAYEEAMQVFNALPFRDVVSWNTLISGCFERGNDEYALECFDRMQHEGLYPDVVTFTYILKACGRVNAAYRGAEIHVEMVRNKMLEGCSVLGSALLDMYIKCGALARAQSVFDDLKFGDVVLWTSLMAGYCEHGESEIALECFEKMRLKNLSPDAVTFACVLKACGQIGAIERGKEIHTEVIVNGMLEDGSILGNALVDMYAKCGVIARAMEIFSRIQTRDVISWNAIVEGHAQLGHKEEALSCYVQMTQEGFHPDIVTLSGMLKAYGPIDAAASYRELPKVIVNNGLLGICALLGSSSLNMHASNDAHKSNCVLV